MSFQKPPPAIGGRHRRDPGSLQGDSTTQRINPTEVTQLIFSPWGLSNRSERSSTGKMFEEEEEEQRWNNTVYEQNIFRSLGLEDI